MRFVSPLRYPGGKARLGPYFSRLVLKQPSPPRRYAEPFAGGAGAALSLLFRGDVEKIYINDLDPGIAAFWRSILYSTDQFINLIMSTSISVDKWHECRQIYCQPHGFDDLTLGFATFFLNRVNRSGILRARPIGGLDQSGVWKMDARFNRLNLANRVEHIARYRRQIMVYELDASDFILEMQSDATDLLVYLDPPYVKQGRHLYLDGLALDDHRSLATTLRNTDLNWVLTYDSEAIVVDDLYKSFRCLEFDIAHTAQDQHIGSEFMIFANGIDVPDIDVIPRARANWVRI